MNQSIAVFCGSKSGAKPEYIQAAEDLGVLIAKHNCKLIYGGGNIGIMGAIADAVIDNNGYVIGVIPTFLYDREIKHTRVQEMHVVDNMHIRKSMMYELCDRAIILPGGYGTLDELFEIITWNSLQLHHKKIAILNTAGFYNHLIAHLNQMQQEGFLYENWQETVAVCNGVEELFN
jgi:uncharacterized protein (TIGR00730 family)